MLAVLGVFCLIFFKEVPKLYRNKLYKELAAFLVFFCLALAYTLVVVGTGSGPSPTNLIDRLLSPLINYLEQL